MKNFAIAGLLMLLTFDMNAQVMWNDDWETHKRELQNTAKYRSHLAANHITHFKAYSYYSKKHPEGILSHETSYDPHGNPIETISYNKHGKIKEHSKRQYNDSGWMTSDVAFKRNGKPQSGDHYTYDKLGNITKEHYWWKDSTGTAFDYTAEYTSAGSITEAKMYSSKGKLFWTANYEYYDDGSKKKTTMYDRKGKVIGVWNYDCNPIGKLQESRMKDTSKICVHYETDKNGNQIKVMEDYTQVGWLFKYRLRTISKYDKDNHPTEQIDTKMDGKETQHVCIDWNAQGRMTEYREYVPGTNKIKSREVYTYDNSGNLAQTTVYAKSSTPASVVKYVYN